MISWDKNKYQQVIIASISKLEMAAAGIIFYRCAFRVEV